MIIDDVRIDRFADLDPFRLPMDLIFPGATLDALRTEAPDLAPDHVDFDAAQILLAVQTHVLRIGGLTVLVDTCIGEDKDRPRRTDWDRRRATGYLGRLAALGLRPGDVDLVVCTHLHADHVGWNTRLEGGRWVPTFPKARYLIGAAELAAWRGRLAQSQADEINHGSYADSVLPIIEADRALLVETGHELAREVTIVPLPGHSPGQIGIRIDRPGGGALFCGDAIHSPAQVYRPGWSSRFCDDPAASEATRRRVLDEAAETGQVLIPAHLRNADGMRIRRVGAGFGPDYCGCGSGRA